MFGGGTGPGVVVRAASHVATCRVSGSFWEGRGRTGGSGGTPLEATKRSETGEGWPIVGRSRLSVVARIGGSKVS